jgi:hypothetical protein
MPGHELGRSPGGNGASVRHDQDRVREALGLLDVVRGHEDRGSLGPQRVDQRPELLAHLRVEPDRRLVEEDKTRTVHEGAGDQQAPAHAAGELVHAAVPPIHEVRHLQRPLDRCAAVCSPDPIEVGEDEQVLLDRQRRVEVVELRRDAALRACDLGLLGQPEAQDLELALVGDRLGREEAHRRRLPRPVGAEQADARPLGHVEVEAVDRDDRPVALDDAAQADGKPVAHVPSLPAARCRASGLAPGPSR